VITCRIHKKESRLRIRPTLMTTLDDSLPPPAARDTHNTLISIGVKLLKFSPFPPSRCQRSAQSHANIPRVPAGPPAPGPSTTLRYTLNPTIVSLFSPDVTATPPPPERDLHTPETDPTKTPKGQTNAFVFSGRKVEFRNAGHRGHQRRHIRNLR